MTGEKREEKNMRDKLDITVTFRFEHTRAQPNRVTIPDFETKTWNNLVEPYMKIEKERYPNMNLLVSVACNGAIKAGNTTQSSSAAGASSTASGSAGSSSQQNRSSGAASGAGGEQSGGRRTRTVQQEEARQDAVDQNEEAGDKSFDLMRK